MNILKSYKKILILGLCVIGFYGIYYALFMDIKNKNEHISVLENELSSGNSKQQLAISMQQMIKNSDSDITRINDTIVGNDGDVLFIENLESLAKLNNLSISIDSLAFQNHPLLSSSTITFFNIKGKIVGRWLGTYLFLAQLESLPLKVKINDFAFANTTEGSELDTKKFGTQGNTWQSVFDISVLKYK